MENYKVIYSSWEQNLPRIWSTSLIKSGSETWFGTRDGIRIFKNKKLTNIFSNNKYLSSVITSMEKLNNDFFLIGTKNYGLLIMQHDSIVEIIDESKGLLGNLVRAIHIDNQKVIWVGTNRGISRINYLKPNDYSIYNLTKKNGLVSNEIMKIRSYKNTIYVATPKGLIEFDKTKVKENALPPLIYIKAFNVNEQNKKIHSNNLLIYSENNITISYEGLSYRGNVEYQYRLLGVDTSWILTKNRNVRYQLLKPNDYTFEVKATIEDGIWSKPIILQFTISPPFWLTWWFKIGLGISIISIIYIGFKINVLAYNKHVQQEILNRILKKLGKQSYLLLEIDKKYIRINENSILYVEAFKNYVEINTTDKKYLYRSSMVNMEEKLSLLNFMRVHRSFIVQKDKIDSISEGQLKIQNHSIPIGKTYQKKLKELKNQFIWLNN